MGVLAVIFWISIFVVFYAYIGYGLLIYFVIKGKNLFSAPKDQPLYGLLPRVALVIPAFNEEKLILAKIGNTLALDYPADKLSVIFLTDGSTDKTPDIIRKYPQFRLFHQRDRMGKAHALNRIIPFLDEPVVIFNDANTLLNRSCILEMVKHFADDRVGGVAGEKRFIASGTSAEEAAFAGEGLYWKYESWLKKLDAAFYSVVGAAGELFAIRRELYEQIAPETIIEDFVLSLKICLKGYIISYEPKAYAMETSSESMREEQKRKIRICAGGFQAMGMLKALFNVFINPRLSFLYISHRVLRWTLCPVCIVLIFFINYLLVFFSEAPIYAYIFGLQLIFYTLALAGWYYANNNIKVKGLIIPYYFLFMNISVFMGFARFIRKKQSVLWEKSVRKDF